MGYPIFDVPFGGGILMGVVAIAHVIVAHFAIGGGLVIAVTETLAVRRGDREMRDLAYRASKILILVSTVFGAISGVGIWVVAGLISPFAIATLIRNYVWGWAIEWVFFIVEIVAALVYFATWDRISKRAHLMVIWLYFVAAYFSLVVINGIITFMLTPGRWLETHAFWDGFFNPTYWPALVLRTGITLIMATAFMVFAAKRAAPSQQPRLLRFLGGFLVVGVVLAYAGYRWWEGALPEHVTGLFLGSSANLPTLAATRHLVMWSLTATLGLGVVFLALWPRGHHVLVSVLLMVAAFTFFGSYERLREGVRKPFLIRDHMFSNGVRVADIAPLNEEGILSRAGWAAREASADPVQTGHQVFRAQCASCHTLDGYQGIRKLLPEDRETITAILEVLAFQGEEIAATPPGQPIATGDLDYPFMPPFVGTAAEMEALAAYLADLAGVGGDHAGDATQGGTR